MKYYIIAGEASGDLHGSNLMRGIYSEDPEAEIRFWGGDFMREAGPGATLVRHYKEGAVMGLTDVMAKAGRLLANVRYCKEDIRAWGPDVVILIDYRGFNFKIAKFAHKQGHKVFYYIAPKTWASRESRNRKLKAWVDRLFIVFPFEKPYFDSRQIPYTYVGNPLIDAIDGHEFKRPEDSPYIAILAGSRKAEISRMMPVCMEFAQTMHAMPQFAGYKFIVAGAPSRSMSDYDIPPEANDYVRVEFGRTYDILKFADAAVINSGTASLEAALIGTPQVVCWSTSALTIWAAKKILKVGEHIRYISLGNLIVDRAVFKEFIQEDFNVRNVCDEVSALIQNGAYREDMLRGYEEIRNALGGSGASRAVAREMINFLKR